MAHNHGDCHAGYARVSRVDSACRLTNGADVQACTGADWPQHMNLTLLCKNMAGGKAMSASQSNLACTQHTHMYYGTACLMIPAGNSLLEANIPKHTEAVTSVQYCTTAVVSMPEPNVS